VLFGLKLWAGLISGSIALKADAWHTLSDSFSSMIVIFSGLVSARPADRDHPFGHGRIDLICSVVIGTLLAVIGFEFLIKATRQLQGGEAAAFGKIAVVVTVVSIIAKELLAQFAFWAAKHSGNPILRADGWHHRTDALSSILVLVGIVCSTYFWWVDGVLGIIVALMIFYVSYEVLRDSIHRLIGEKPDKVLLEKVQSEINRLNMDVQAHHFHLHRYGDHCELTFHLSMSGGITLREAHEKADILEKNLRNKMNIEATIHMEPRQRKEYESN
jgi:cation diffusion facilitator family transporter